MHALTRKLFRDLWHMRGQALAISAVLGGGVAVLVMALGTRASLDETRRAYYERYRFADVFAQAVRAPEAVAERVAALSGVISVETRIAGDIVIDKPELDAPARGRVISLPDTGEPALNAIALRRGRMVLPHAADEAVISEVFADASALAPGDRLSVIMEGRKRSLLIVGVALSPEYVYAIAPGELVPDNRRFGVLWMSRTALAAAFDMGGAFNDISLLLASSSSQPAVIDSVDGLLARYGGLGAYGRKDQISHAFLDAELIQLGTMAGIIPPIFLGVAAFLLNVAASRLVKIQREQIGLLKAFGYTNVVIGGHFLAMMMTMAAAGIIVGWVGGAWLGRGMTALYADQYVFPFLYFRMESWVFAVATAIGFVAAGIGALAAVRDAVRLTPAVAMAPPAPTSYQKTAAGRLGLLRGLSAQNRMILRQVTRWPMRAGLTMIGIAMSVALLISTMFFLDSIDEMLEAFFERNQRQDVTVTFTEALGPPALHAMARAPGVITVEGIRAAPVRLKNGHIERRAAIIGLPSDGRLVRLIDAAGHPVPLPSAGLVLADKLASLLAVNAGDTLRVEFLDGRRGVADVAVVRVVEEYIGTNAYMDLDALGGLMAEGPRFGGVHLAIAGPERSAFFRAMKEIPVVQGVSAIAEARQSFHDVVEQNLITMVLTYVLFAGMIAAGVVYNAARVALSERGRDLASLRVLGFTRGEVTYIFLGELALLLLPALPLGCGIGFGLAALVASAFDSDLYRIPLVINASTYGWSVLVILVASVLAGVSVARRLNSLDLVAVLKTRE